MADDTGWTFAQLPCSGTFNDAMPATVDIGEGTVRWRVYQDAAQFINNPKAKKGPRWRVARHLAASAATNMW